MHFLHSAFFSLSFSAPFLQGECDALNKATTAVMLLRALNGKLVYLHTTSPRSQQLHVMPGVTAAKLASL